MFLRIKTNDTQVFFDKDGWVSVFDKGKFTYVYRQNEFVFTEIHPNMGTAATVFRDHIGKVYINDVELTEDNYQVLLKQISKPLQSGGGGSSDTPEVIKEKYESNPNTNAFTDSYKKILDGYPGNDGFVVDSATNKVTDLLIKSKQSNNLLHAATDSVRYSGFEGKVFHESSATKHEIKAFSGKPLVVSDAESIIFYDATGGRLISTYIDHTTSIRGMGGLELHVPQLPNNTSTSLALTASGISINHTPGNGNAGVRISPYAGQVRTGDVDILPLAADTAMTAKLLYKSKEVATIDDLPDTGNFVLKGMNTGALTIRAGGNMQIAPAPTYPITIGTTAAAINLSASGGGKAYYNSKEIATIDQIPDVSGFVKVDNTGSVIIRYNNNPMFYFTSAANSLVIGNTGVNRNSITMKNAGIDINTKGELNLNATDYVGVKGIVKYNGSEVATVDKAITVDNIMMLLADYLKDIEFTDVETGDTTKYKVLMFPDAQPYLYNRVIGSFDTILD